MPYDGTVSELEQHLGHPVLCSWTALPQPDRSSKAAQWDPERMVLVLIGQSTRGGTMAACPSVPYHLSCQTVCRPVQVTEASTVVLTVPHAPSVKLDDKYYKLVDKMEALTEAPPSLKDAKSLTVKGPVLFRKGCIFKGDTLVVNGTPRPPLVGSAGLFGCGD